MRSAVLAAAVVLAAACHPPPPSYATAPPPSYATPAPGAYGQAEPPYRCTDLEHGGLHGSLCYASAQRCESERSQAQADGARTSDCRPQRPVSCFQLGGDPAPASEMCASSTGDCELWRRIDRDKNGQTGAPCEWRHGEPGTP